MKKHALSFIFALTCVLGTLHLFAAEYVVIGRIVTDPPEKAAAVPVVLLRIDPHAAEGTAPMFPIARSETDPDGAFRFADFEHEERFLYQVGVLVGSQRLASEQIRFEKPGVRVVEIVVPSVQPGLDALQIDRRVVVVSPLADNLRITEILEIQNSTTAVLDGSGDPRSLPLPSGAYNLVSFSTDQAEGSITAENGFVLLKIIAPVGASRIIYEYDLTADYLSPQEIRFTLESETQSFELISAENGGITLEMPDNFASREKIDIGGLPHYVTSLRSSDAQNVSQSREIRVLAKGIPLRSGFLWVVGVLFLILLIGSTLYFVYMRSEDSEKSKNAQGLDTAKHTLKHSPPLPSSSHHSSDKECNPPDHAGPQNPGAPSPHGNNPNGMIPKN